MLGVAWVRDLPGTNGSDSLITLSPESSLGEENTSISSHTTLELTIRKEKNIKNISNLIMFLFDYRLLQTDNMK